MVLFGWGTEEVERPPPTVLLHRGYRLVQETSVYYDLGLCIDSVRVFRLRDGQPVGSWSYHFESRGRRAPWSMGLVLGRGRSCSPAPDDCSLDDFLDAVDAEQSTRRRR